MYLTEMKPGETGNIVKIARNPGAQRKLFELGIVPGARIKMISRLPLRGPVLLEVGNSRIALGRKVASDVEVILVQ